MRASKRCATCNTVLQGGVPSCPNQDCASNAPPPAPVQVRHLPDLVEYVAHGYPAERYPEAIEHMKAAAVEDGVAYEVGPHSEEDQKRYDLIVAAQAKKATEAATTPPPPAITPAAAALEEQLAAVNSDEKPTPPPPAPSHSRATPLARPAAAPKKR